MTLIARRPDTDPAAAPSGPIQSAQRGVRGSDWLEMFRPPEEPSGRQSIQPRPGHVTSPKSLDARTRPTRFSIIE